MLLVPFLGRNDVKVLDERARDRSFQRLLSYTKVAVERLGRLFVLFDMRDEMASHCTVRTR